MKIGFISTAFLLFSNIFIMKSLTADICAHDRFGINVDFRNKRGNPSSSEISDSATKWIRVEFQSGSNFSDAKSFYKGELQRLGGVGMKPLMIVGYAMEAGKPESTESSSAVWDKYFEGFYERLDEIVPYLDANVGAWQIWNEPDMPYNPAYDPGIPPKIFGKMLVKAAEIIKKHSKKPIIAGGMGAGLFDYFRDTVNAAGTGWSLIDATGLHPYGQRVPDSFPNATWGFGTMKYLFDVYLQLGKNKPLWITEIGVKGLTADQEAQYLENVYTLAESYGERVQKVFWFCWSDGMVSPYGLKNAAGDSKKSYERFKKLAIAARTKACQ